MNKEKVRELVIKLNKFAYDDSKEEAITRWLEQNQSEPVVVGLTDEQIKDLACVVSSVDYDDFHTTRYDVLIQNWLKTQTFTQPEAKEVVVGLSERQIYNLYDHLANAEHGFVAAYKEWAKTQTFTQPEVREITVGLSKSDIDSLTTHLDCFVEGLAKKEDIKFAIEDWLKTQTFTQPSDVAKRTISRLTDELKQCYDIIKSQQFTPSWDDAPSWANWLVQSLNGEWVFFEEEPENYSCSNRWVTRSGRYHVAVINRNWQQTLQERPKPTPEVGQVWIHNETKTKYQIDSIGQLKVEPNWTDCVTYRSFENGRTYTRELYDFLEKFEKVS